MLRALAVAPLAAMAAALAASDVTGAGQGWGGPLLFGTPVLLHGALAHARLRHREAVRA